MNVEPIIAPLAVALVTAGSVTASAAGAFAATDSPTSAASASVAHPVLGKNATLQQIQAAASSATGARITKLNAALTKVNADKTLTASDRSALLSTLQRDLTGMKDQQTRIAADTTTSQARADYTTIFRQYRVLAVALPQERIVRAADHVDAAALPRLQSAEQRLASRLEKKPSSNTAAPKAALTDLQQQITTVKADAQGLDAAALALTPAQFNRSHSVLADVKAKAQELRTAMKAAQKDIRSIRQALRS